LLQDIKLHFYMIHSYYLCFHNFLTVGVTVVDEMILKIVQFKSQGYMKFWLITGEESVLL
jgi:hypothetical protein